MKEENKELLYAIGNVALLTLFTFAAFGLYILSI